MFSKDLKYLSFLSLQKIKDYLNKDFQKSFKCDYKNFFYAHSMNMENTFSVLV